MSIVDYFVRIGRKPADSDSGLPVYRSWWFAIPLALCLIDTFYEIWILAEFWRHLTSDARFWLVFLAVITAFALIVAHSQYRAVRDAGVSGVLIRRLSITTVFVVSWAYFMLGITLHLIVQFIRHS